MKHNEANTQADALSYVPPVSNVWCRWLKVTESPPDAEVNKAG